MATLYRVDGTVLEIKPADPKRKKFTLTEAQTIVGGYIQTLSGRTRRKSFTVLCDEDGQSKGLPYNHKFHEDYSWALVGDVLVMAKGEF